MGRLEKVLVLGVLFVTELSTFSFAQSTTENLVITTYYPSPSGSYRDLTVGQSLAADTYDYGLDIIRHGTGGTPGAWTQLDAPEKAALYISDWSGDGSASADNYGLVTISASRIATGDGNAANAKILDVRNDTTAIFDVKANAIVQVVSGYLQIPRIAGAPANNDCDEASEIGRIAYSNNNRLYVCDGPGRQWDYVDLTN